MNNERVGSSDPWANQLSNFCTTWAKCFYHKLEERYAVTEDWFWNDKIFWGHVCAIYGSWGHLCAIYGSVVSSRFKLGFIGSTMILISHYSWLSPHYYSLCAACQNLQRVVNAKNMAVSKVVICKDGVSHFKL